MWKLCGLAVGVLDLPDLRRPGRHDRRRPGPCPSSRPLICCARQPETTGLARRRSGRGARRRTSSSGPPLTAPGRRRRAVGGCRTCRRRPLKRSGSRCRRRRGKLRSTRLLAGRHRRPRPRPARRATAAHGRVDAAPLSNPPSVPISCERAPVDEPEVVAAGVAGVEQPQPHPLGGHVEVGIVGAVDEDLVAEHADVGKEAVGVVELVVAVEAAVLDDHRDVVDAVVVGQVEVGSGGVVEDEHPGEAAVDVLGGLAVGVRVVPQRRRRLVDGPRRPPRLARVDRLVRPTVHAPPAGACRASASWSSRRRRW